MSNPDLPSAHSEPVSPFHIPGTGVATAHSRRVLKNANNFAVLDDFGQAQASAPEGLFFEDTRYLSRLVLTINGMPPLLMSSTVTESNTLLSVDLTNPEMRDGNRGMLQASTVHLLNRMILGEDALLAAMQVRNYGTEPVEFDLAVELDADYIDIFEVRGIKRSRHGRHYPPREHPEGPIFSYRGLDGVRRSTRVIFEPGPETQSAGRAEWHLSLTPGASWKARIEVHCEREGRTPNASSRARIRADEAAWQAERREHLPGVATANATFDEWLRCSRGDLEVLATETEYGLYPYAGVPWFSTAFGRDGLVTALECLWLDPELAKGTLRFLAAHQAKEVDPKVDAEPGKILHEMRLGEMATLGEVPFGHYYGSIDATPLFVVLAAAYHARTGDRDLIAALWPHIEAALAWMSEYGDVDGDGFIEYSRKAKHGLDNQGWKDSFDAIFHADGAIAEPPIALVEVQAYAYAAYVGAAAMARLLGHGKREAQLAAAAERLKERFEDAFWIDELGVYAPALDGDKRPCRVVASNAGHALFGGIARADRAARVCETLMGSASFSGWGIRTIAEGQARYNPMSYHNGSVWPHDNALIALGFARYRFKARVLSVLGAQFGAAQGFEMKRMPELFCGFARRPDVGPTAYPMACAPQAWSAASVFALLAAALGIAFVPERHQICFNRPVLPTWLGEIRLTRLRLGDDSVDILFRRDRGDVAVEVMRRDGPLEIIVSH